MRRDSGFSLIECLVASVLCATGLLALGGASRAMLDLALLGHRTAAASEVATARLATLHASVCAGATAGISAGTYAERWTIVGGGPSRTAAVDVSFAIGVQMHSVHVEGTFACPP